jgi:hypothetical protein
VPSKGQVLTLWPGQTEVTKGLSTPKIASSPGSLRNCLRRILFWVRRALAADLTSNLSRMAGERSATRGHGHSLKLGHPSKTGKAVITSSLRCRLCPTTHEWIKKMWYLYTMEFYAAMKKTKCCHSLVNGWNWRTSF